MIKPEKIKEAKIIELSDEKLDAIISLREHSGFEAFLKALKILKRHSCEEPLMQFVPSDGINYSHTDAIRQGKALGNIALIRWVENFIGDALVEKERRLDLKKKKV